MYELKLVSLLLFCLNVTSVQADEPIKNIYKQEMSDVLSDLEPVKNVADVSLFYAKIPAFITSKSEKSFHSKDDIGLTTSPAAKKISSNPRSQFLSEVSIDFIAENFEGSFSGVIGGSLKESNIAGAVIYQARNNNDEWQCYIDGSKAKDWHNEYLPPSCKEGVPPPRSPQ